MIRNGSSQRRICEVWRRASDGETSGRLVDSPPREWMSAFVTVMAAGRTSSLPSCCATRFFGLQSGLARRDATVARSGGPKAPYSHSMIARWRLKAHSRRGARGCKHQAFRRSNCEHWLQINDSAAAYQTAINGSGIGRTTLVALDLATGRLVRPFDAVDCKLAYYLIQS